MQGNKEGSVAYFFTREGGRGWFDIVMLIRDASFQAIDKAERLHDKDEIYLHQVHDFAERVLNKWNNLEDWHHEAMNNVFFPIYGGLRSTHEIIGSILSAEKPWDVKSSIENNGLKRALMSIVRANRPLG
jgi:hypothetical protein